MALFFYSSICLLFFSSLGLRCADWTFHFLPCFEPRKSGGNDHMRFVVVARFPNSLDILGKFPKSLSVLSFARMRSCFVYYMY